MTYISRALLFVSILAWPAVSHAQMIVIGKGNAAQCYNYAKQGNKGTLPALEVCETALDENLAIKDRAATRVNRGILLMRKDKHAEALLDYQAALEIRPNLTEAHVNLGAALIHLDRFDEALVAMNTALEDVESKTRPAALVNRAILYDRQENYTAAYRDLKAAKVLAPDWEMVDSLLNRYTVMPKS